MISFVGALIVFAGAVIGMSIGILVSNRCLRGSCGGLSGMKDEHGNSLCESCSKPSPECRRLGAESEPAAQADDSVDCQQSKQQPDHALSSAHHR